MHEHEVLDTPAHRLRKRGGQRVPCIAQHGDMRRPGVLTRQVDARVGQRMHESVVQSPQAPGWRTAAEPAGHPLGAEAARDVEIERKAFGLDFASGMRRMLDQLRRFAAVFAEEREGQMVARRRDPASRAGMAGAQRRDGVGDACARRVVGPEREEQVVALWSGCRHARFVGVADSGVARSGSAAGRASLERARRSRGAGAHRLVPVLVAALVVAGCAAPVTKKSGPATGTAPTARARIEPARLRGRAYLPERMQPGPGASLEVQLIDDRAAQATPAAATPAATVAVATFTHLDGPPYAFALEVERARLRAGDHYSLRAILRDASGRLEYMTPTRVAVAPETPVEFRLVRAGVR